MSNETSVAAHWSGPFEESKFQRWCEELRARLAAPQISLGLVFISPANFEHAPQILEVLRVHARIPLLIGCSSTSLIAGEREIEEEAGVAVGLYALPGAELKSFHLSQSQVEEANGPGYWHLETGIDPSQCGGWLAFADPFRLDCEAWLRTWNEAYAPLPVLGGLAVGDPREQSTQLYLNGDVFQEGAVAMSISGAVKLAGVVSQGCTPIGDPWTLTEVERNVIHKIGNQSAYKVLEKTFNELSPEEKRTARHNLLIGLAVNEYSDELRRGDFLIRNLLGVDPQAGTITVGAFPRAGQTMRFQRRSADAASEDMNELLAGTRKRFAPEAVLGGCLCSCNGRGRGLFGRPDHDAHLVQQKIGPLGVAGFFCNGEIGPVGNRNFLHGYTASLALFVKA